MSDRRKEDKGYHARSYTFNTEKCFCGDVFRSHQIHENLTQYICSSNHVFNNFSGRDRPDRRVSDRRKTMTPKTEGRMRMSWGVAEYLHPNNDVFSTTSSQWIKIPPPTPYTNTDEQAVSRGINNIIQGKTQ